MRSLIVSVLTVITVAGLYACGSSDASQPVRQVIYTSDAPTPTAAYSQGILFGDTLYCAGQIGLDPSTGALVEGGTVAEADRSMKNLGAVLAAAGMSYSDAVMVTAFLTNMDDYAALNELYATYFPAEPPARQVVEVTELPRGASVEISLVAIKDLTD